MAMLNNQRVYTCIYYIYIHVLAPSRPLLASPAGFSPSLLHTWDLRHGHQHAASGSPEAELVVWRSYAVGDLEIISGFAQIICNKNEMRKEQEQ